MLGLLAEGVDADAEVEGTAPSAFCCEDATAAAARPATASAATPYVVALGAAAGATATDPTCCACHKYIPHSIFTYALQLFKTLLPALSLLPPKEA